MKHALLAGLFALGLGLTSAAQNSPEDAKAPAVEEPKVFTSERSLKNGSETIRYTAAAGDTFLSAPRPIRLSTTSIPCST